MERYLAVWNGEAALDDLGSILSPAYRGHIGLRERTASDLRADIRAYRERLPGIRFTFEHQFAGAGHIASRLTAHAVDPATEATIVATGINISRWEDGLLAEEWAVWAAFEPSP